MFCSYILFTLGQLDICECHHSPTWPPPTLPQQCPQPNQGSTIAWCIQNSWLTSECSRSRSVPITCISSTSASMFIWPQLRVWYRIHSRQALWENVSPKLGKIKHKTLGTKKKKNNTKTWNWGWETWETWGKVSRWTNNRQQRTDD